MERNPATGLTPEEERFVVRLGWDSYGVTFVGHVLALVSLFIVAATWLHVPVLALLAVLGCRAFLAWLVARYLGPTPPSLDDMRVIDQLWSRSRMVRDLWQRVIEQSSVKELRRLVDNLPDGLIRDRVTYALGWRWHDRLVFQCVHCSRRVRYERDGHENGLSVRGALELGWMVHIQATRLGWLCPDCRPGAAGEERDIDSQETDAPPAPPA